MLTASPSTVYTRFVAPALQTLPQCPSQRHCPVLSDSDWLRLGIERVLQEASTGRGFLQTHGARFEAAPELSHYFHSLRSPRRLRLLEELNPRLIAQLTESLPDELAAFPQLQDFDVYAGDGHWHSAAAHDAPAEEGTRYAVGHFYCLDLRRRTLRRLATAQGKKEHDMHALKRLSASTLRQGAPKGRKVLYVWDKAGIDFRFWYNLKASAGVYFISLEKENMDLTPMGEKRFDPADPLNHGVLRDELVGSSNGVLLRRITYPVPDTGQLLVFLTNELTLPPGLIAFLYGRRWTIEKVFDSLKNKFQEQKAWASSPTAKALQAELLCLVHNLTRLMEHQLAVEEQVVNVPDRQRRHKRLQAQQQIAQEAQRPWPSTWQGLLEPVHCSVKLIRWLRSCFVCGLAWTPAVLRLRALYAKL